MNSKISKRKYILNISQSILFFLVSLFFFSYSIYTLWKENSANYWNKTIGVITSSTYNCGGRGFKNCSPKITYRYLVDKNEFENDDIFVIESLKLYEEDAIEFSNLYRNDKDISVFYNPQNPAESFLLQSNSRFLIYVSLFIAITTLIISVLFFRYATYGYKKYLLFLIEEDKKSDELISLRLN